MIDYINTRDRKMCHPQGSLVSPGGIAWGQIGGLSMELIFSP